MNDALATTSNDLSSALCGIANAVAPNGATARALAAVTAGTRRALRQAVHVGAVRLINDEDTREEAITNLGLRGASVSTLVTDCRRRLGVARRLAAHGYTGAGPADVAALREMLLALRFVRRATLSGDDAGRRMPLGPGIGGRRCGRHEAG